MHLHNAQSLQIGVIGVKTPIEEKNLTVRHYKIDSLYITLIMMFLAMIIINKKVKNSLFFIFFLIFPALSYSASTTSEVWNNLNIKGKLWGDKKKEQSLEIRIENELRYKAGLATPGMYYVHVDLLLSYTVLSWLNLGAAYRHAFEIKSGKWQEEIRPHFNLIFQLPKSISKNKLAGFSIKNRSRLEGRFFPSSSAFRYRNKTNISYSYKFKNQKSNLTLKPYIETEFFYDHAKLEINRNRFSVGLGFKFYTHYNISVGYLLQSDFSKGKLTKNANVFTWKAGLSF